MLANAFLDGTIRPTVCTFRHKPVIFDPLDLCSQHSPLLYEPCSVFTLLQSHAGNVKGAVLYSWPTILWSNMPFFLPVKHKGKFSSAQLFIRALQYFRCRFSANCCRLCSLTHFLSLYAANEYLTLSALGGAENPIQWVSVLSPLPCSQACYCTLRTWSQNRTHPELSSHLRGRSPPEPPARSRCYLRAKRLEWTYTTSPPRYHWGRTRHPLFQRDPAVLFHVEGCGAEFSSALRVSIQLTLHNNGSHLIIESRHVRKLLRLA